MTETCPDPWTHEDWYRNNETTWLKTAEQRKADRANGCPHCGKPLPKEESADVPQ